MAIENGFNYFVIVDSENYSKTGAYTTPSTSHTTANVYGYGNYAYGSATTKTSGGQTFFFSKPRTTNTILCFKEKPQIDALIFDAHFVLKSIRNKYGIR